MEDIFSLILRMEGKGGRKWEEGNKEERKEGGKGGEGEKHYVGISFGCLPHKLGMEPAIETCALDRN